jgi:hypothetical protein
MSFATYDKGFVYLGHGISRVENAQTLARIRIDWRVAGCDIDGYRSARVFGYGSFLSPENARIASFTCVYARL